MFSFFFDKLYEIREVRQAFKNICIDKMLSDGYFDMRMYIEARIEKEDMLSKLVLYKSRYSILYKNPYPSKDSAAGQWNDYFNHNCNIDYEIKLSNIESEAIVNWMYMILKNTMEREEFTKEILKNIKDFEGISNSSELSNGVVFNRKKVEIKFISSISELNFLIASYSSNDKQLFFRGHANSNYILLPSVMRSKHWRENESNMYNELLINCPEDFEKCHTHFEKLVKMQHYGLPTRLLDITRNPLVALYFACESQFDSYGEITLISVEDQCLKYPQSDTVSILASLPLFSYEKQKQFSDWAINKTTNVAKSNKNISRLLHEIRLEKPAFRSEIRKKDLLSNFIVYASKSNNRIIKQDGAFILCGLLNGNNALNNFRYNYKRKTIILLVDKKQEILRSLDRMSINYATLFPEIECVSEYIKNKFK